MEKSAKILVTGGSGLIGSALISELKNSGFSVIAPTHSQCDLEDRQATLKLFEQVRPDYVFQLAGKVGGIQANMKDPVGFYYANALIEGHVLEASLKFKAKKVAHLSSSCIYPREAPQPMREELILTGPLEPTNEGYALAKISAMKLGKYYYDQHGLKVVCPLPSNAYGPGDTFDLDRAHVLSALVRRFVDAKNQNAKSVTLWGTGVARRQFMHVRDVARGLVFFMQNVEAPEPINLGPVDDMSIRELAEIIAKEVGFQGEIQWDSSKPNGMLKKCLDTSRMRALGFEPTISLHEGIREVIQDYTIRFLKGNK